MLPQAVYRFELAEGRPDEFGRVMLPPCELACAISFALTDRPSDDEWLKASKTSFHRAVSVHDVEKVALWKEPFSWRSVADNAGPIVSWGVTLSGCWIVF